MAALGIKHLFSPEPFGGFGSDFCSGNTTESWKDRSELVQVATEKARKATGGAFIMCTLRVQISACSSLQCSLEV